MEGLLRSELLASAGFAHGFSLRGVDFTWAKEQGPEAPANHRRFVQAMGSEVVHGAIFEVTQVHGGQVEAVDDPATDPLCLRAHQADALVTAEGGVSVVVRVADCLPLLLADPKTGAVAAVHCGWRGTAAGVVASALASLAERGADAERLLGAIGPHIRVGRFEVGEEVVEQLARVACGAEFVRRDLGTKPHVDLAAVVIAQLRAAGVTAVDDVGGCTMSEPGRFFSFRRDGQASGRHLAAIVASRPLARPR